MWTRFADRALNRIRARLMYDRLYRRYAGFTMIPRRVYKCNLALVSRFAHVPGDVVECGTWKGGMIAGIAELLGPRRRYHLYDSFEGLPPAKAIDGEAALKWQANTTSARYFDNCRASEEDATQAMALAGVDYKLHKGWFEATLPGSIFPSGIAILRMDADWYESTITILNHVFMAVNRGGCIIIDDYHTWDGCSKAVHDFLSRNQRCERIDRYKNRVAFIKKRA
jgi:O-methyltransferase